MRTPRNGLCSAGQGPYTRTTTEVQQAYPLSHCAALCEYPLRGVEILARDTHFTVPLCFCELLVILIRDFCFVTTSNISLFLTYSKGILMKSLFAFLLVASAFFAVSCSDDATTEPTTTDPNVPSGQVTTLRSGTITAENSTPTAGVVSIVRDAQNNEFISLGDNFVSDFHTGTVTIYLAKEAGNIDMQQTASSSNVLKVALVNKNGKQYFKIPGSSAGFPYVVFYCATAKINFGNSALSGQTTTLRTGSIMHQDGPATSGDVAIIKDAANSEFIQFKDNFSSDFASGTVTVYLAKNNANINSQPDSDKVKVGLVNRNGMQLLAVPGSSTGYTYVVLYCSTVQINFGAAALQ